MTRVEREQMIARYLGGEMNAAEEQEFFIRVAVDKELRHDLRAHRTVDSALRKDRDAESTGHTALRMRVSSVLAATPVEPLPVETAPVGATAGGAHPVAAFLTSTVGRWLSVAIVSTAVTVAVVSLPESQTVLPTPTVPSTEQGRPTESDLQPGVATPGHGSPTIVSPIDSATAVAPSNESAPEVDAPKPAVTTRTPRHIGAREPAPRRSSTSSVRESRPATTSSDLDVAPRTDPSVPPDAESFDRREERRDDSIDIGINVQFPDADSSKP